MTEAALPKVLLIGKPNSGKSLLFNRLTGLHQKVANFPGVTVDVKHGRAGDWELIDLPGLYGLTPLSRDEEVATAQLRLALADPHSAAVLLVLDATRLERSLVVGLEVQDMAKQRGLPCLFALNMWDELTRSGLTVDCPGLSTALAAPVLPVSAKTRAGIPELTAALRQSIGTARPKSQTPSARDYPALARELAATYAPITAPLLARQRRLDGYALSTVSGLLIFLAVMTVLFQSIFTWAQPLMNGTAEVLKLFGDTVAAAMPTAMLGDFVRDGLLGGISAVAVFAPQIFVLTLLIGALEDSGYLARAAILCHRPLSALGLSGRSFVPLLSGHACAIPALMAARTIESPRARWLTWMAIPLMACSARLPVYGLLIAALIPDHRFAFGLLGSRGLALMALYVLGIVSGLSVAALVHRVAPKSSRPELPLVLELPPYRIPAVRPLLRRGLTAAWAFVRRAGGTIFAVSLVVWLVGYFPNGNGHLESSWLADLGRFVAPIFAPLGLDWKVAVAVMTSFLAREVFVGTLGVLVGIESAKDHTADMASKLQEMGMTLASGVALLVFFAFALQCVSTLAVLRRESGSRLLPTILAVAYTALAYVLALVAYRLALPWN